MCTLARALARKEISSVEATEACLAREAQTRHLGAFLHRDAEGARTAARASDARRARRQERGPFDGVPVAVKDNFMTRGRPTTCASRILADFVPPKDATAVVRLEKAGMILLGKHNMDEFAMGSTSENSAFFPVRNPYAPDHVAGGSSGGSATSVACGSCFISLGTDTGGSVRQPAALTGCVGFKPTYGRIPRTLVAEYASSLDHVGLIAKDVTDCAALLPILAGPDGYDATCTQKPFAAMDDELEAGAAGMRLGVPREYVAADVDPEVAAAVEAAMGSLERLGAQRVEVSLPHTAYGIATYYILAPAEASSNLARYDGVRYGRRQAAKQGLLAMYTQTRTRFLGAEVKRRLMMGTYALSAGHYEAVYGRAQRVRTRVCQDFAAAWSACDALIMPTTPAPAPELGAQAAAATRYESDKFTVLANLASLPALSLPCGHTRAGLPIGLQIVVAPWRESWLLRLARAFEREHVWHLRRPACGVA